MPLTAEAQLARRAALELKHDSGDIDRLLDTRTEVELRAADHRAMVRYCDTRIADFTAQLAKIEGWPDSDTKTIWLNSTRENLEDMRRTKAHHEADLAALSAPVLQAAQ